MYPEPCKPAHHTAWRYTLLIFIGVGLGLSCAACAALYLQQGNQRGMALTMYLGLYSAMQAFVAYAKAGHEMERYVLNKKFYDELGQEEEEEET